MDSIQIDTGIKRICVNGDPERVIIFNPSDVTFAERFYSLAREIEEKRKEFIERGTAVDANKEVDENGIPANAEAMISLLKDLCEFLNEKIDQTFGPGTSKAAFDGALSLDAYPQFIDGILPYIETVRSAKLDRYTKRTGRAMK